ncbi:hypothetical protein PHLGIDRAFT_15160 [Phlebiopsis gigantea 11061_1 CR5-6]|uniref:Uncharacterized protein n=1 Tax=Phlebiopsis gigantea (strain 11061_1 CR5-6) TaxID=745531 RepID=A0A0C3RU70_PHLG1|nr:hypothetical protein PHLGIDRAFT_15160 [Phlebiopsis gigantea 11061_1 CR5-6]
MTRHELGRSRETPIRFGRIFGPPPSASVCPSLYQLYHCFPIEIFIHHFERVRAKLDMNPSWELRPGVPCKLSAEDRTALEAPIAAQRRGLSELIDKLNSAVFALTLPDELLGAIFRFGDSLIYVLAECDKSVAVIRVLFGVKWASHAFIFEANKPRKYESRQDDARWKRETSTTRVLASRV